PGARAGQEDADDRWRANGHVDPEGDRDQCGRQAVDRLGHGPLDRDPEDQRANQTDPAEQASPILEIEAPGALLVGLEIVLVEAGGRGDRFSEHGSAPYLTSVSLNAERGPSLVEDLRVEADWVGE